MEWQNKAVGLNVELSPLIKLNILYILSEKVKQQQEHCIEIMGIWKQKWVTRLEYCFWMKREQD